MLRKPPIVENPDQQSMHDTFRCNFNRFRMATGVHYTVRTCPRGVKNNRMHHHRRRLLGSLAFRPFDFVSMDIVGPSPKSLQGIQYILIITSQYSRTN